MTSRSITSVAGAILVLALYTIWFRAVPYRSGLTAMTLPLLLAPGLLGLVMTYSFSTPGAIFASLYTWLLHSADILVSLPVFGPVDQADAYFVLLGRLPELFVLTGVVLFGAVIGALLRRQRWPA